MTVITTKHKDLFPKRSTLDAFASPNISPKLRRIEKLQREGGGRDTINTKFEHERRSLDFLLL